MKWLLVLYPPAWRRRYRSEMEAHLEGEPKTLRTAVDLVAGAIDAWLNPEMFSNGPEQGEEKDMYATIRGELCAPTRAEARRSTAWMLGTSLFLTTIAVVLDKTLGDHIMIDALLFSAFFIALTVSAERLYLRPYSRTARGVLIGLSAVGWYAFFLLVFFIASMT